MSPPLEADKSATLDRALGVMDAVALSLSSVIGVGIFTVPGIVARMVPNPWVMLGIWLVGGLLALMGAAAYAELGVLRPRAGGEYVYLREAFGPMAGFLTGWVSFVAGFSGAIAAGAVAWADYLGHFIPAASDVRPFFILQFRILTFAVSKRDLMALLVIFLLSLIHICGLRPGRLVQNTLTSLLVMALLVFIVLGFALGSGSKENLLHPTGQLGAANWMLALVPVMFTYSGWNAATYVAEELREPRRNVPLTLLIGTGAVTILYLLLNALYLFALPSEQLSGQIHVGDLAARALFGSRMADAATLLILLSLAGGLSAWIITGPRIYYAMAQDGLFFRSAARVHPRFRTPAISILVQALWSGILVLSGTFEQLLIYTGFAILLFSGGATASLFVLRRRKTAEPGSFKVPGYPVFPAIFALASLAMVVNVLARSPKTIGAGFLIMLAGLPLYAWWIKRTKM
jgi:basic amino acid/polyamine antiporter, APA family